MNTAALIAPVIMFSIVLVITGVLRRNSNKNRSVKKSVAVRNAVDSQQANKEGITTLGAQAGSYVIPEQKRLVH